MLRVIRPEAGEEPVAFSDLLMVARPEAGEGLAAFSDLLRVVSSKIC
jgi:hypothetical protein